MNTEPPDPAGRRCVGAVREKGAVAPQRRPTLGTSGGHPIRWWLLVPAVGLAFLAAGITGAIASALLLHQRDLVLVGPMCAAAWVLTAWAMAPAHKTRVAVGAFLAGALAAAAISTRDPFGRGRELALFLQTCAGGLLALGLILALASGRQGRVAALCWFVGQLFAFVRSLVRHLIEQGVHAMQADKSVRNVLNPRRWAWRIAVLVALVLGVKAAAMLGRASIDIVPQGQRGLYMRLGKYVRTLEPGLHLKVPLIDRIHAVAVEERQGYVQHVDAMTRDNVIMRISLQYTYEVADPRRYRLEVVNADTIIQEFVQGKLRDIVNTTTMSDVMQKRQELGLRITTDLAEREEAYGIHFKLVQIQGTYPPTEVEDAIKRRMVTEQQTVAAREEASQKQILADANLYEAQKQTEAAKFRIEETAKAQKESIRMLLEELAKHEALGPKYLEYLTSQELKSNSKWIIAGGAAPQLHLETNEN